MMLSIKQSSNKICYMILPEGIRKDLHEGLNGLAEKHGVSIVVIEAVNWNDDLTPCFRQGRRGVRNLCALISANVTSLAIFTTNARNGIGEPYTDPGR